MKKRLIALISIIPIMFIFIGVGYTQIGDIFCSGSDTSGNDLVRIKSDGTFYSAGTITNNEDIYLAPAAAASKVIFSGVSISTAALKANGTAYTLAKTDYVDVVEPRNIVIISSQTTGLSTAIISLTATLVGKDKRGNSISETVLVSTSSTKSGATGTSNYAYSTLTSVTIASGGTITGTNANCKICIGVGTKMGIKNNIIGATDIIKVIENSATSTAYTLSSTYDTITFAAAPNGTINYKVIYNSHGK